MNELALFNFENKDVRVAEKADGEFWFIAKDVCAVLGNKTKDIPRILDEDERGVVDTIDSIGRNQATIIISESGLYSLILKSRKPEAKKFKRWVTHEVLPSIRKTGQYKTELKMDTGNSTKEMQKALSQAAKSMRDATTIAKLMGLRGNQAILSANRVVSQVTGVDCGVLFGTTHLICDVQERHLTATELGRELGGLSAQKTNKLLEERGLIACFRNTKNKVIWKPTETGVPYTVLKDTGKKHGDGTMVQQMFYLESVIGFLKAS